MNKTPIIIAFTLFLCAIIASIFIFSAVLSNKEIIDALVAVFASLGALISATFVIYSYLQTNKAFVEAQRPHLLIQVVKDPKTGEILILYRNITNNRFNDLTISLTVTAINLKFDLSYLFRKKMVMIGQDNRHRIFSPIEELKKHGLDLQEVASGGNEILLSVNYAYTFNSETDFVQAQKYKWDTKNEAWEIC